MPLDARPTSSGSSSADSSYVGSAAASAFTSSASNSDSETDGVSRKRKAPDALELGSGDEGVIDAGRKKKKRKKGGKKGKSGDGEAGDGLEEEEGVGARVRRRRKGQGEGERKTKPPPDASAVTIDVDEVWARMNSAPEPVVAARAPPPAAENLETSTNETEKGPLDSVAPPSDVPKIGANDPMAEEMISIKRTYVFAGETITEEKEVPKTSEEARLHLQTQSAASKPTTSAGGKPLRRPLKRRSRFDPPPEAGTTGSPSASSPGSKDTGRKLNTIEKSKMDWAGYVDKAGIKEELTVAEKAKDGYLGKMDFLGRVDAKRENEISSSRKK